MNDENKMALAGIFVLMIVVVVCFYTAYYNFYYPTYSGGCRVLGEDRYITTQNRTELELFIGNCTMFTLKYKDQFSDISRQMILQQLDNIS